MFDFIGLNPLNSRGSSSTMAAAVAGLMTSVLIPLIVGAVAQL